MITEQSTALPRSRSRLRKLIRLTVYCGTVGLLSAGLALNHAYASVKDAALELGSELGKLDDAGDARPIVLNGQPVFISSAVDDVPLKELLDRVAARCAQDPAGIAEELPRLPEAARKALAKELVARGGPAGVIRQNGADRGMVACFVPREHGNDPAQGDAGKTAVGARFAAASRILETGDLSALGDLRYVFAEKTDSGLTHIVTAWTDGTFNLFRMLANEGDAPGSDLPDAPRPEGSVRLLSASIEGVPYGLRVYAAPGSPEEILARYDAEMRNRGWELMVSGGDVPRRVYARAGEHLFVTPRAEGERTVITFLQMRGR